MGAVRRTVGPRVGCARDDRPGTCTARAGQATLNSDPVDRPLRPRRGRQAGRRTARARVITIFGAVLALNGADTATVGAVAPQLEQALHIGNTKIGLLSAVTLLVGAVFTIPVGLLVDRIKRIPMLSLSIVLWSIASLLSAFAGSYSGLLLTRLVLGAVVATAGPAIASLTGDYFPARERGQVYAYILGGEIAGTAFGFIISSTVASLISWRAAFFLLAIPGFFLARELYRTVPEPLRGGQSRLEPGVVDLHLAAAKASSRAKVDDDSDEPPTVRRGPGPRGGAPPGRRARSEARARARSRTLHARSTRSSYILSIPTNVLLIISSSLGYFFFSGLSTFALLFVRGHYHVNQATAELVLGLLVGGAMIGTLAGGRLTDVLVHRGSLKARIWVPARCYLGAAALLVPGFFATPPDAGGVVRRGRRGAPVGRQPAARRRPARHHARGPVGPRGEHAHGRCARSRRRWRRSCSAASPT